MRKYQRLQSQVAADWPTEKDDVIRSHAVPPTTPYLSPGVALHSRKLSYLSAFDSDDDECDCDAAVNISAEAAAKKG